MRVFGARKLAWAPGNSAFVRQRPVWVLHIFSISLGRLNMTHNLRILLLVYLGDAPRWGAGLPKARHRLQRRALSPEMGGPRSWAGLRDPDSETRSPQCISIPYQSTWWNVGGGTPSKGTDIL